MENSGRQKFEESWREAFEDSEMEPSGLVWNNIDQKLDNEKMKRRVVFYQRLAAAAVIFALLIGVASTSYFQINRTTQLASETKTNNQQEQQKPQELAADDKNTSTRNRKEGGKTKDESITTTQSESDQASSDEEEHSVNEKQTQEVNTKQYDKQNQSLAQADENAKKQSTDETGNSSAKSLVSSDKKDTSLAKREKSTHSNSSLAFAEPNTSNKNKASEGNKIGNTKDQSLPAQSDSQIKEERKEAVNSKNDLIALASVSEAHKNDPSQRSVQSQDNAYSRMTSYFSPQLKNNKLPKGIEPEPKRELPAMPASLMASSKSDKRSSNEDTWLSFGAAAGSYNPGNAPSYSQSPAAMQQFATANIMNTQAPQSATRSSIGSAYSVGLSFGKKIADRWIVHTGVNYMNQAISYTSNYTTYTASNDRTAFVSDYADKTSAPLAISQPYKVNSSNEFVSVPMQAGYLIVDRKFGLQWNAGVATDVFLRNTLKDQSGRSDKYTQGSGDDSPYRAFNFAALTSTEFSYKLGGQYRVSLVPGVRYSFQSVLKSQSGTGSNPLVLDIGFRFRYIFNAK